MLWDVAWVERVRAEMALDAFRHPLYHALAGELLAGRREPSTEQLVDAWEQLAAPPAFAPDLEAMFNGAVAWLRERPLQEQLEAIDHRMVVASPDEKELLQREKLALLAQGAHRPRRKTWQKWLDVN